MPTSGGVDLRRLYVRFLLLVMVPVTVLVGFGVLAIRNERAAVETRFRFDYTQRLHRLAQNLITTLETEANRLARGTHTPASDFVRFEFAFHDGTLVPSRPIDRRLQESLAAVLKTMTPPANGSVTLLPIPAGSASGLYAVRELPDHSVAGLSFSQSAMVASVQRDAAFLYPGDAAHFSVEEPPQTGLGTMHPLMALLDEVVTDDLEQGVISLPLPGALSDWRIQASVPESDPFRGALWNSRVLYIVTLFICAGAIAFGVLVTLRSIWQEARLSRLKTDFVSNISHELRTPLASIRMFAETLRQGRARTPEEQAACLEFITRESERLTAIAQRTLDWARIEAGQQLYTLVRTPTAKLVDGIIETFLARGLVSRDVLQVQIDAAIPDIEVDTTALSQVLVNLLENAVKYTGPEKRIVVRVRRAGKSVNIAIEDNGIGISSKDKKRVFERFFRADDLLSRQTEGTGLGLSISQRIVEAHRGKLSVESTLGRGSVFTISLPGVSAAASAA